VSISENNVPTEVEAAAPRVRKVVQVTNSNLNLNRDLHKFEFEMPELLMTQPSLPSPGIKGYQRS
jgi:hypothetical protein